MGKADDYLNAANALVCVVGTATADSIVPGAGTALSGGASISYLRRRFFGRTPELNARIAERLKEALEQPTTALPPEADILIPQMIERGAITPADIMAERRNPAGICDVMLAKLTDRDHKRDEIQRAFHTVVGPVIDGLLNDPEDNDMLRPAFETAMAETLGYIAEQVELLTGQQSELRATAEELGVAKYLFIGLANRIAEDVEDIHGAHRELSRALDTAAQLNRQAQLPSNTGDQVNAVLDRMAALNAEDKLDEAAAELDRALAEVDDDEAALAARRVRLLEIGLDQDILRRNEASAAARIVARVSLDHAEPAARFNALRAVQDDWYARGLRYGLPFDLDVSIAIARLVQKAARDDQEKGAALNDLAIALAEQGTRTGGAQGTALLAESVSAYRDALTVTTRDERPVGWAGTHNNLGNALQEQGIRTGGAEGTTLLAEAVQAYRDALTVYTRDDHPVDWAATQNNLGNALAHQGTRTGGAEGTALLAEAVSAYRDALTVRTRDDHPVDWAMTQNNIAIALQNQGTRTGGAEGTALLAEAVSAYRDALTVYTRDEHPVQWAMTQNNLGGALRNQGSRTGGAEGTALLAEAVSAHRNALTVTTRDDHPVDWAMTQNNLGNALRNQGTRTGGAEGTALLAESVSAYRDALTVYTRDEHPVHWAATQMNLANALGDQGEAIEGANGLALLAQALAAYSASLQVYTLEHQPAQWAQTRENMALTEVQMSRHPATADPRPHLEAALEHVEAALTVYDPENMPYDHGTATSLRDNIRAALDTLD